MTRLNLGCGGKPIPGYVNIDFVPLAGVDMVHDLRRRLPYDDGTVEEIYAKHLVEHFTRTDWPYILADWVRVLAPSGRIVIEAPDALRCMEYFVGNNRGIEDFWHLAIFGEDGPGMRHQQAITLPRLRADLESVGMRITRARNWHDDHPDHIGDPAWQYNLRMEAVKP